MLKTTLRQDLLTSSFNRPKRPLKEVRGIVIHGTANTDVGADAQANRNYFNNNRKRHASAHFVVDEKEIVQCIPENEIAYHVGDEPRVKNIPFRMEILMGQRGNPNDYLLGIEMCVNKDGNWVQTYQNTIQLVSRLMDLHQLSLNQLYRHIDITGKKCPMMFLQPWNWQLFKYHVQHGIQKIEYIETEVIKKEWREIDRPLNSYSTLSLFFGLIVKLFSFNWLKKKS